MLCIISQTYAGIIPVHVYLNGVFSPCRWLLWTSAVRRPSLRSWESTNSLSRPQVSLPLRPEMCIFTNNNSSSINTPHALTHITSRIIFPPPFKDHSPEIDCTSNFNHYRWKDTNRRIMDIWSNIRKLKSNFLAIDRYGATAHGCKIHKTPYPVALIYFSKSALSEWFPKLCVRPLQNPALVLECSLAEERTHPWGALLLIVEGQLKSQLKSGFVRNAGPDEANGGKRKGRKGAETVSQSRRKDILCVYSVVISMPGHMYCVALCCRRRQQNAAQSQSRSEEHLWQE